MTDRQKELWVTPEGLENQYKRQCLPDLIEPVYVARMVLFLASDDGAMCTPARTTISAHFETACAESFQTAVVVLVGPIGWGKSTAGRMLCEKLNASSGKQQRLRQRDAGRNDSHVKEETASPACTPRLGDLVADDKCGRRNVPFIHIDGDHCAAVSVLQCGLGHQLWARAGVADAIDKLTDGH